MLPVSAVHVYGAVPPLTVNSTSTSRVPSILAGMLPVMVSLPVAVAGAAAGVGVGTGVGVTVGCGAGAGVGAGVGTAGAAGAAALGLRGAEVCASAVWA